MALRNTFDLMYHALLMEEAMCGLKEGGVGEIEVPRLELEWWPVGLLGGRWGASGLCAPFAPKG